MVSKPAFIPDAIKRRLIQIPTETRGGLKVIPNFAVFFDTHRDQPHVGTFGEDIHRGECKPTPVDYVVGEDLLVEPESGRTLQRHDKHMFLEVDWYSGWLMDYLMEHDGKMPTDGDGAMVSTHFRDPREKRYLLRSFRQMVMYHYNNTR